MQPNTKKRIVDIGSPTLISAKKNELPKLRWRENGMYKIELISKESFEVLRDGLGLKVVRCRS